MKLKNKSVDAHDSTTPTPAAIRVQPHKQQYQSR
jgi:hypothetical protein